MCSLYSRHARMASLPIIHSSFLYQDSNFPKYVTVTACFLISLIPKQPREPRVGNEWNDLEGDQPCLH